MSSDFIPYSLIVLLLLSIGIVISEKPIDNLEQSTPLTPPAYHLSQHHEINGSRNIEGKPADTSPPPEQFEDEIETPAPLLIEENETLTWSMKLVNEDVTDEDLDALENIGIDIISGEWGIGERTLEEMLYLLDRLEERDMSIVINLTEGTAWGFKEDGTDPEGQKPVWQRDIIEPYIEAIQDHPAIFAYDISNEAGENLPGGSTQRITLEQIQEASDHIRSLVPHKPIMIRMHYWDEYDGDFDWKNPFAAGIADIVMLNLYSNYTSNRTNVLLPDMIEDSGQELIGKIHSVDPNVDVWIALGAFQEFPYFLFPTQDDLKRDIDAALKLEGISNIGFFGWGPERYPNEEPSITLQDGGEELLEVITSYTK